jgi:hypothetical protein
MTVSGLSYNEVLEKYIPKAVMASKTNPHKSIADCMHDEYEKMIQF